MKLTNLLSLRRTAPLLTVLLAVAALTPAAWAQGSIAGTVTDATTNETLPGVNVFILGTTQGGATDLDGDYRITGLRAGDYTVQVSLVGYETKQFTGIRVNNGETTRLDIELGEAMLSTENEVVIVGEKPLVDVEESASSFTISREQIEAAPVREVQEVVASQAGVVRDPTGLYIRGGRADETAFLVDGVSAKDPLAGTGFGLDLGTNAFAEVEVTTGGLGAEVGDVTSGVVSVTTRDGGDVFAGSFSYKRDNLGVNEDWVSTYNEDIADFTFSGPIIPGKLRFFTSGQTRLTDTYTRQTSVPEQVRSSLFEDTFWMPRQDNRWSGLAKLTYLPKPGMKLQGSYQRSLTVNQSTRMLQVTGNDVAIRPGYQYAFALQPDAANTYAHDNNIAYLKWTHVLNDQSFYEVQASRLFTRLRADANGRRWRPDNVDTELDPESIVTSPDTTDLFLPPGVGVGDLSPEAVLFLLPGPGLFNNGGIAQRWHDHFAEELTLRGTYTRFAADQSYRLVAGFETKVNDYQWIDIERPWIGAPIRLADGTVTQSNRLGEASDIWRVKPIRQAFFVSNEFRYRGLIATLGLRLEMWAPGKYVDDLVADSAYTIPEPIRQGYGDDTFGLFGYRFKARALPKVRVSFPIRENQVLFFNYGRSTKLPHPTFVYTGLDPFYQDRSFFADLGNPNLNPEVDISYELGLRSQITRDDALTVTAFWRDKFDFITTESVIVTDATGRDITRALRINGDFARVRGLEASYTKRIGQRFSGQLNASYSRASGLSSSNNDALQQLLQQGNTDNTVETPLAWDRPVDVKASVTYRYDESRPLFGVPGLNRFRAFLSTTVRSGQRYTPADFVRYDINPLTGTRCAPDADRVADDCWRPIYETDDEPTNRFSETGAAWWWFDLSLERRFELVGQDLRFSLEITNLFNQNNAVIVNPVTGEGYPDVDPSATDFEALRGDRSFDVTNSLRDPRFEDPSTSGLPPFNPARYLPQRHIVFGLSYAF